mgnify:CR=1 FL=1
MKIHSNIPSLQQGGGIPFVSWSPIPSTPVAPTAESASSKSSTSTDGDDGLLSKEMIKLLMEQGLPSDVEAFTMSMNNLYNDPIYRASGSLNTNALSSQYLGMLSNLNKISFYREQYDNSVKRLTENGGLYDIALSEFGKMFVQNVEDGRIMQVTPQEYSENRDSYKVMTNGDLAHLRATNTALAFSPETFKVLNNGIGQEEIQKLVNNTIQNIGKTATSSSGYLQSKGDTLINGLNQLLNDPDIQRSIISDGAYKVTTKSESNVEQANAALDYLVSTLPENARNYLRAKAVINGYEPDKGVSKILLSMISSKYNVSSSIDVDYDASLSKQINPTDNDKALEKITPDRVLLDGYNTADSRKPYVLNPRTGYEITTASVSQPVLTNYDGTKAIGQERMDKVLIDSTLAVGNKNNMWIGDRKVNPEDLTRMMYNGDGVSVVYLPVDQNGAPDFEASKRVQDAEADIKKQGGKTLNETVKRQIYQSHQVGEYYDSLQDPQKSLNKDIVRPFFVVNAKAASGKGVDFKSPYLKDLGTNDDAVNNMMQRILTEGYKGNDLDTGWFPWTGEHIYEGTFFIEAPDIRTSQTYLSSTYMPKSMNTVTKLEEDEQKRTLKTTFSK